MSAQDAVLATRAGIRRCGAAQEHGISGQGRWGRRTGESRGEGRAGMARAGCESEGGGDARGARGYKRADISRLLTDDEVKAVVGKLKRV